MSVNERSQTARKWPSSNRFRAILVAVLVPIPAALLAWLILRWELRGNTGSFPLEVLKYFIYAPCLAGILYLFGYGLTARPKEARAVLLAFKHWIPLGCLVISCFVTAVVPLILVAILLVMADGGTLAGFSASSPEDSASGVFLEEKVTVDPQLDSPFFRSAKSSWPWNIVEHNDGTLEDTLGGRASKRTVKKIEHTAECTSSHQGEHQMDFCDLEWDGDDLILVISGGLPAYASSLAVTIRGEYFTCAFEAVYPSGEKGLKWRIIRKQLIVKSDSFKTGTRLYAWVSVEFEEGSLQNGKMIWRPYKIEGFLKPVIPEKFTVAAY